MGQHYHPARIVRGSGSGSAGRPLVRTVLTGVTRGVRKAAPAPGAAAGKLPPPAGRPAGSGDRRAVPGSGDRAKAAGAPPVQQPAEPPKAFEIDDELTSYPDIAEIQSSPVMLRYFGLRDLYGRRFPYQRLREFAPLRPAELAVMMNAYDQLQRLSPDDWRLLEEQAGADRPPGDWTEASRRIDDFVHSARRAQRAREIATRDAAIDAAHARVSPGRERQAIDRLTGLSDLYEDIKLLEIMPDGTGSKEFRAEFAQRKRELREKVQRGLRAANFATVDDFDLAVRALRQVVRDRAVNIALATMKQSERVVRAELQRYGEPAVLVKLATELASLRRPPPPSEDTVLAFLGRYPILLDERALQHVLPVRVPDILGDVLRQNAQAQLGNIDTTRATLASDPEDVFSLNRIIDETLEQLSLPPESVPARLIREGRAAPERHPVRAVVDKLLLVLSFAWGPLAVVGYAARVAQLLLQLHDAASREEERVRRTAANAGARLADPPAPSGQGWEVFALVLAVTGVIGGAPQTLLPNQSRLSARAVQLLAKGVKKEEETALAFLHGTQFVDAGGGRVVFVHPDFPDEVFHLDAAGLTRYRNVQGVPRQTGHWAQAELENAGTPVVPVAKSGPVRSPRPAPEPPAPVPAERAPQPRTGPAKPGFGSLGAAARLSPETAAAEARLRALIQDMTRRAEDLIPGFGRFMRGDRKDKLLKRAEEMVKRLRSYDQRLTSGLAGFRKGFTHEAMDQEVREAIAWLEPRLGGAMRDLERLERLVRPVPLANAAEQAVIDRYVARLSRLRDLQQRVEMGDASALAGRDAVRDELAAIEQRARSFPAGEENLLPNLETLAAERRVLLTHGVEGTLTGLRSTATAATILPGELANRSYAEIVQALGRPPRIELPNRIPVKPSEPLSGAATLTWAFPDGSYLRIDVPGPGSRPFASGMEPHIARVGPGNVHFSDHGIVVPVDTAPAHIPLRVTGQTDPLHAALAAARRAAARAPE
ncbi:hypothetical protein ACRYCC_33065 [Actinomadura scrupuli]|uniref:hypothetical protein n=1 Tax=Actinomadura scrupuli TaxID=559629 RepID=UPI003D972B6F